MSDLNYLYDMMRSWGEDIRYAQKIENLSNAFMRCNTMNGVHAIVKANADFFYKHPECFRMSGNTIKRIKRVQHEKFKSWNINLN